MSSYLLRAAPKLRMSQFSKPIDNLGYDVMLVPKAA